LGRSSIALGMGSVNILKSRISESRAEGAPDGALWVRTGDYGTYFKDHLYIADQARTILE
ncbi:hypothetical protein, partial [Proteus mirabilis]|uniref:hypothetical protein n=1 Tax=Proteus mirabilis TaxID=584 RepID=UPI001953D4B5